MKGKIVFVIALVLILVAVVKYNGADKVEATKSKFQTGVEEGLKGFQEDYNNIADDEDWQLFERVIRGE